MLDVILRKHIKKRLKKRDKLDYAVERNEQRYTKASIKSKTGVSKKYERLQQKADVLQRKADKKKYGLFSNSDKAAERQAKADAAQYKANKYKARYDKRMSAANEAEVNYLRSKMRRDRWVKSMEKTFSDIDVSVLSTGESITKKLIA